jgi:hypothetical protein
MVSEEYKMNKQALWRFRVTVMLAGILALVTTLGAQAQPTVRTQRAPRVVFADGYVSFMAPLDFTELTSEEIATKFPLGVPPRRAIGNARRTTSISFDLLDQPAPSTDLNALRGSLMQSFAQLPKLKWIASEVRRAGSGNWAYLEFTCAAADQEIHNVMLLSVYKDRPLLFNFSSTVVEFPRFERALRASMASITAAPIALGGVPGNKSQGSLKQ